MNDNKGSYLFLNGGGELGRLTRDYSWDQSPVGSPEFWPQSLRTMVSTILNSRFPMFLWWGTYLTQFYNDAYRPSLGNEGKHPTALGQSGPDCWPEIWETIGPLINQVLEGGDPVWSQDQLIPIFRNGQIEEVYWTFGYSPVLDDQGSIAGVLVICQETTQHVAFKTELLRSEHRFRGLVEQAPVAVALFNGPDFIITSANERVLEYWDKTYQQVINRPLFEAVPEVRHQGLEELLSGVYATGIPFKAKERPVTLRRNGELTHTYIDFIYTPFFEDDQTVSGIVVICTEITQEVNQRQTILNANEQLTTANKALKSVNEDLERSNDSLKEFAYVASHDLQEPLRKIKQFSSLLMARFGDRIGEGAQYVERIQSAASRMSVLMEDLLSFSRLSTQQDAFALLPLEEVLNYALNTLELTIQESNAQIKIGPLPNVSGIASQLRQLFENLLSNAIKFSSVDLAGHPSVPVIVIESKALALGELPAHIKPAAKVRLYHCIQITDNGVGFEQKYRDRIFQLFQRLHGMSKFTGTGIGLAICEKIVHNHNGAITANSVLGEGATFEVYLPAAAKDS
ncbi:ATP-binding protein [Dyadobacter sp. CY347]|uniref:sensor histidine kinase n=1 Tax=Dyadobacter sp. CY347 TaxID=2909336 RepID=UPI001F2034ED|nr:PAS domain-containing sensor histidine kinase [Dyadobacter sp. CY347]MCF2488007.1 PAS domain-containing protein [Dyadobacter sp. CY347]